MSDGHADTPRARVPSKLWAVQALRPTSSNVCLPQAHFNQFSLLNASDSILLIGTTSLIHRKKVQIGPVRCFQRPSKARIPHRNYFPFARLKRDFAANFDAVHGSPIKWFHLRHMAPVEPCRPLRNWPSVPPLPSLHRPNATARAPVIRKPAPNSPEPTPPSRAG